MRIETFLASSALYSLYQAYDQVMGDFQARLKTEGVHFLQALIITGMFFEEKPIRPGQLAESLGSSASNISHAIRGLERAGLIERSTSPLQGDARAYFLTLTRAGRKKAGRLIKILDSIQDQIEAAGSRDLGADLRRFVRIYQRCRFPSS